MNVQDSERLPAFHDEQGGNGTPIHGLEGDRGKRFGRGPSPQPLSREGRGARMDQWLLNGDSDIDGDFRE